MIDVDIDLGYPKLRCNLDEVHCIVASYDRGNSLRPSENTGCPFHIIVLTAGDFSVIFADKNIVNQSTTAYGSCFMTTNVINVQNSMPAACPTTSAVRM